MIIALVTLGLTGYHWYGGAAPESSFRMTVEDYQVAMACPTDVEAILGFVRRPVPSEGYLPISTVNNGDWAREACMGEFEFRDPKTGVAQEVVTPTSTPSASLVDTLPPTASPSASTSITTTALPQSTSTAPTSIPVAMQISSPTPTITPTALPTITPEPSPTPAPRPNLLHLEEKQFMLELINDVRVLAGLETVELGDNVAAQLHAEASLENCSASHWGPDGLKPYMRYSLAGGYQSNGENGHGSDYCVRASDGYRALGNIKYHIRQAMEGLMESSGHRRNILDRWHKKVNIGLAWDVYNFVAYQHFEGDYVEYDRLPAIEGGVLSVSGRVKYGLLFSDERDLGVQIFFDPAPHALTRGQVARTYCYDSGLQIAALRPPLTGNSYYPEHQYDTSSSPCPDPYDVPSDAPAPRTHDEAHVFWQEAYSASQGRQEQTITVPWITATEWFANGETFFLSADVASLIASHGEGVYSIIVWGKIDSEDMVVSQYSMFHGVEAPDTYD